ncbi:MAG: hypothetical protein Tsb009_25500 [Planctomycetaceae bacterium]
MPKSIHTFIIATAALFTITTLSWEHATHKAYGQARKSKSKRKPRTKTPSVQALDTLARKATDDYLRLLADTAMKYEKAGQLEKSKAMLRTILKLNPTIKGVKEKLKALNEEQLQKNPTEFSFDTNRDRGWRRALVRVFKNRPFRIQVSGAYEFSVSRKIDARGFPHKNPTKGEMVIGIPTGALMGIIASQGKVGKPFLIGEGREITPKEDGLLFLNINAPRDHRCRGKLKIQLSGAVAKP